MTYFRCFLLFCLTLGFFLNSAAGPFGTDGGARAQVRTQVRGTGLPLPRFVSLRAGEVNLRTGPGVQYPVDWVYLRQHLPVEIIAEYGTWRKIRDWQGTRGWVHQSMVSGNRTFIVTGEMRTIRRKADSKSGPIAKIEAGAIGKLLSCPNLDGWCRVKAGDRKGYLRRVEFWGVLRNEVME